MSLAIRQIVHQDWWNTDDGDFSKKQGPASDRKPAKRVNKRTSTTTLKATSNACRLLKQSLTSLWNTCGSILPILWSKWLLNTTSYLWKVTKLLGKTKIVCLKKADRYHKFTSVQLSFKLSVSHKKLYNLPIVAKCITIIMNYYCQAAFFPIFTMHNYY